MANHGKIHVIWGVMLHHNTQARIIKKLFEQKDNTEKLPGQSPYGCKIPNTRWEFITYRRKPTYDDFSQFSGSFILCSQSYHYIDDSLARHIPPTSADREEFEKFIQESGLVMDDNLGDLDESFHEFGVSSYGQWTIISKDY
jgi:hypothetical protein